MASLRFLELWLFGVRRQGFFSGGDDSAAVANAAIRLLLRVARQFKSIGLFETLAPKRQQQLNGLTVSHCPRTMSWATQMTNRWERSTMTER